MREDEHAAPRVRALDDSPAGPGLHAPAVDGSDRSDGSIPARPRRTVAGLLLLALVLAAAVLVVAGRDLLPPGSPERDGGELAFVDVGTGRASVADPLPEPTWLPPHGQRDTAAEAALRSTAPEGGALYVVDVQPPDADGHVVAYLALARSEAAHAVAALPGHPRALAVRGNPAELRIGEGRRVRELRWSDGPFSYRLWTPSSAQRVLPGDDEPAMPDAVLLRLAAGMRVPGSQAAAPPDALPSAPELETLPAGAVRRHDLEAALRGELPAEATSQVLDVDGARVVVLVVPRDGPLEVPAAARSRRVEVRGTPGLLLTSDGTGTRRQVRWADARWSYAVTASSGLGGEPLADESLLRLAEGVR